MYRITLSPLLQMLFGLSNGCRFEPSCSHYFETTLERFGLIYGGLMGIYRLIRCNPFCKAGWDPVPKNLSLRLYVRNKKEEEGI